MITEKQRKEIRKLIGRLNCPKDFICYQSGFEQLCQAEDLGLESFLKCLEGKPTQCTFSISYGDGYYCRCPLRVFIAKEMKQ
jgi:hypothetical protein